MEEPLPSASNLEPERRRESRSPSPDICSICLSPFNDRCYSDGCFHMFCFICLLEWSKVKLECPLCKKPFNEVYHNIKDYQTYKVHKVTPPPQPQPSNTVPRLPLTHFADITWQAAGEVRRLQAVQRLFAEYRRGQRSRINNTLPNSTLRSSTSANFRRYIYANELYCEGAYAPGGETRVRSISPSFFATEPARCHRLVPWLNRELLAILPHKDNINQVIEIILEQIRRVDIRSERFRTVLEPFTLRYTEHFVHEFRMFAICPFDMAGFDRYAKYARGAPRQSALEQYNRPLLLTSSNSDSRPDMGQTRSRRSRWEPVPSGSSSSSSTSQPGTVHQFTLNNFAGTSSAVQLSISAVVDNTAGSSSSSLSQAVSESSRSAVSPTLSSSSSDSDIQVVSPPHQSRSILPTTSNHFPTTSSSTGLHTNENNSSDWSNLPSTSMNSSVLPSTSRNRPPTPIIISDSDSDSSISIADTLMQRKGSAAMNTRRTRLSASSSCSSPEKRTIEGSVLDRCREPQLTDDESSDNQASTSGMNRKSSESVHNTSSSSNDCVMVYQPETSKSSSKTDRKHHKHKKSKKPHKRVREDYSYRHSSTDSNSSPHRHSKRHKSHGTKTFVTNHPENQRVPGIETFRSQSNSACEQNDTNNRSRNNVVDGASVPTSRSGEGVVNGEQETSYELREGTSRLNAPQQENVEDKEDIRQKIRLFTKRVIAPKYKDE